MPEVVEARAVGLSERSAFTLLHCGQPMEYRGSRSTWQGKFPNGTSTLENRYRCGQCEATLDFKLVEPDQPDSTA